MDDENNTNVTSQIVVSPKPKHHVIKSRKFWVATIVILVVISGVLVTTYKKTHSKKSMVQVQVKPKTYSDVSKEALGSVGSNKPKDAVKVWQDYLKSNPAKADQYNAYKQLGVSYLNTGEYDKAKDAFNKAKAISNDNDTQILSALAQIEEKEGHTQTAIDAYKSIITILQTNIKAQDSTAQFQTAQDITTLQRTIVRLGGTP